MLPFPFVTTRTCSHRLPPPTSCCPFRVDVNSLQRRPCKATPMRDFRAARSSVELALRDAQRSAKPRWQRALKRRRKKKRAKRGVGEREGAFGWGRKGRDLGAQTRCRTHRVSSGRWGARGRRHLTGVSIDFPCGGVQTRVAGSGERERRGEKERKEKKSRESEREEEGEPRLSSAHRCGWEQAACAVSRHQAAKVC